MPGKEIALTSFGSVLRRRSERLVVEVEGKTALEIPVGEVGGVYVLTTGASITAEAVKAVAENGAGLSFLDFSGEPYAFLLPAQVYSDADLRARQLEAAQGRVGLELAIAFLRGKLLNQANNLRYFAKSARAGSPPEAADIQARAGEIKRLAGELDTVRGDSGHACREALMNMEARGAQQYWRAFAEMLPADLGFTGRAYRHASDPANAAINYGYGILYSKVLHQMSLAGLDPYVGFLHSWRKGRPALLYDFVEEYRQYFVDRPLLAWFRKKGRPEIADGQLTREARGRIAERVLGKFKTRVKYQGRMTEAGDIIGREALEVRDRIQGGQPHEAFVWPW